MTRVVLLGASNLALGFPLIVRLLSAGLPRPLEIFAAIGHGRSYCGWSRVLFRGLPGIDACGLWDALAGARDRQPSQTESSQTLALVTDVGNDLIYGVSPRLIADRVERCLRQLAEYQAAIVLTRLPLASIERLSALRFHATKAVFFPRTGGSWPATLEAARDLDARIVDLGRRFGTAIVDQPLEWYGFDPIHIRCRRRREAWQSIFSAWPCFDPHAPPGRLPTLETIRLRLAPPAERRLFGKAYRRVQPALLLNGTPIHLY